MIRAFVNDISIGGAGVVVGSSMVGRGVIVVLCKDLTQD